MFLDFHKILGKKIISLILISFWYKHWQTIAACLQNHYFV